MMKKMAAFGLSGLEWTDDPQTNEEFFHNFLLAFLAGEWDYLVDSDDISPLKKLHMKKDFAIEYNALLGAFTNQNRFFALPNTGVNLVGTAGVTPAYSREELMAQQQAVYEAACALHDRLWEDGSLHEGMTEKEICRVYFDCLVSYHIPGSNTALGLDHYSPDPEYRTQFMIYDCAYGALIGRIADCGGKAACMNLLMGLEGIRAYGLRGTLLGPNSGHIVSYIILDGEEYAADYASSIHGLYPLDSQEITSAFVPDPASLSTVRAIVNGGK